MLVLDASAATGAAAIHTEIQWTFRRHDVTRIPGSGSMELPNARKVREPAADRECGSRTV